jgi:uncharacterized RDD family membrane protein YckC
MNSENPYQPPKAAVADVVTSQHAELASRGARFGAAMIDGIFALVIMGPVMFLSGFWTKAMAGTANTFDQLMFAPIGLAVYLVLHGYLLHTSGQTIGKRLVGTRIVSADDNRILPLWKVFTLRFLPISIVSQIPVIGPLLNLVDSLFVFRGDQRCVHDLIAGSKVINASAPWLGLADHDAAITPASE